MDMSHHARLYVEQPQAIAQPIDQGLFPFLMAPFFVLHRHTWWAPWENEARRGDEQVR